MIILEGPDGAGKTTLRGRLSEDLNIPVAPKFVKSSGAGSGTSDLFDAGYDDVVTMLDNQPMIYDRHPLISEYIYGPIIRGGMPPDFLTTRARAIFQMFASQVHVIWCLPPLQVVHDNVMRPAGEGVPDQMAGVMVNIEAIWSMYHSMRIWWPGESSLYDFTSDAPDKYGYDTNKLIAQLHVNRHNTRSKR